MNLTPEGLCFVGENIKSLTEMKCREAESAFQKGKNGRCQEKHIVAFFAFFLCFFTHLLPPYTVIKHTWEDSS